MDTAMNDQLTVQFFTNAIQRAIDLTRAEERERIANYLRYHIDCLRKGPQTEGHMEPFAAGYLMCIVQDLEANASWLDAQPITTEEEQA